MKRLAVSAEFVRAGQVGGTEQALLYMLDGLVTSLSDEDEVTVIGHDLSGVTSGRLTLVDPGASRWPRFIEETVSYRKLGGDHDAYFFPNYFTPPGRLSCPTVTTIPDLQYLHYPANFSRKKRAWLRAAHRSTLRRSSVVTVYSSFVRADIASRYGESIADRVLVLPIPVSWERFGEAVSQGSRRPYVLSVASHYAHKNLETLVRAFASVRIAIPGIQLVLVGQFSERLIGVRQAADVRSLISELRLEDDVVAAGYVRVEELGALYRGAEAFVFPSLFEGFGLPPVEALGFGLPVITTRCTSLPEVTLGLAEYVDDPLDADELAQRIISRLESGARPSGETIAAIQEHYDHRRIGSRLYDLMVGVSR